MQGLVDQRGGHGFDSEDLALLFEALLLNTAEALSRRRLSELEEVHQAGPRDR
jgi:hypothetical protein